MIKSSGSNQRDGAARPSTTRRRKASPSAGTTQPRRVKRTGQPNAGPARANGQARPSRTQDSTRLSRESGQPEGHNPVNLSAWNPTAGGQLQLPPGYSSLQNLSGRLSQLDPRFSSTTPQGRASQALALAIGGTEVYGRNHNGSDFFTRRGGTGNNMLGFAQFNQRYHASKTSTPESYTRFLGDILNGRAAMPNGRRGGNHAQALSQAVSSGQIRSGADLQRFKTSRGFGGSNWQGIDDGWRRNPGLADALVNYLRAPR